MKLITNAMDNELMKNPPSLMHAAHQNLKMIRAICGDISVPQQPQHIRTPSLADQQVPDL